MHKSIQLSIKKYAEAYSELQHFQDTHPSIPGGDQKTGVIGEYYAYLYLCSIHGIADVAFGGHSTKGWDIQVSGTTNSRIQVKTVSAFSKTRALSRIHKGWDRLFVIYLNREMVPEGFWIIEDTSIFGALDSLVGIKCCDPSNSSRGSKTFSFGTNHVSSLQAVIEQSLGA